MKPQVLLIHGFNVWDGGRKSIGELRGYFAAANIPYHILKYGHFGLRDTRTKNDNVARQVTNFIKNSNEPVIVIGHSNGCAITHLAMDLYGAQPAHCVYINPALKRALIHHKCPSYDVWHSPSDKPVKWAKWLPNQRFRPWGIMGAFGADAPHHTDVINYNKETDFDVSSETHSDVFSTEKLSYFGPLIVSTALTRVKL